MSNMRSLFISVLSISMLATILPPSAHAQKYDPYPWCAVYGGSMSGSSNCGFRTWQQCMATVSGVGGSCEPNQFYNPGGSRKRGSTARTPADQPVGTVGGWPSYWHGN